MEKPAPSRGGAPCLPVGGLVWNAATAHGPWGPVRSQPVWVQVQPCYVWSLSGITSRGQPGLPSSRSVGMPGTKESQGHWRAHSDSASTLQQTAPPHTRPSSAVCIWKPLASIRVPTALIPWLVPIHAWTHGILMGPLPSLPEVRRSYLFWVSPSDASGAHLRAEVQSTDLCYCLGVLPPASHLPPAWCLGNREQMFHFGLAVVALSQPSNAL